MRTGDIEAVAECYARHFPEDAPAIQELLALAACGADLTSRKEFRGHVTCGAIVVAPLDKFLVIHHRNSDRWLFPGGHLEKEDTSLRQAALRELAEETGITAEELTDFGTWLDDVPLHIDCHSIPANPRKHEPQHRHWDFRYAFRGKPKVTALRREELVNWSYVDMEQLPLAVAARLRGLSLMD
jgi:8-oxo-dGTP pyrophosphatase MutT (NUDIX family)